MYQRFDIEKEKWPSFHDRFQWYKTKLLALKNDPQMAMSYSTHRELCNDAFKKADCHYLKGTHCGRHEGCKLADMQDIADAQIRRLGRWDHSRMIQHYSLGIPRTGARHLAGHGSLGTSVPKKEIIIDESKIGNYYLDREYLMPPEELQRMIFPGLEEIEAMNNAKPEREQDIAVRCFMNLLRWFRVVLLQDAVFLRRKYPTLKIWRESVFNNVMFENFARELLHEVEHGETPQYVRVSRAMPDLAHQLRAQHENLMNTMSTHHQSVLTENKQGHVTASDNNRQEHILTRDIILHNLQPIIAVLADLSNSGLTFHTQSTSDTRVQLADSSYIANITTGTSSFDPNRITSTNSFSQSFIDQEVAALIPIPESRSDSIEQYRLAIHVDTVVDLWREYKIGLFPTGSSIQQLDEQFGAKWRTRDDCRKAYSRRRHIWETIIQATRNLNRPSEIIAEKMDRWRENQGYSLQRLNSMLANSRKHNSTQSGLWGHNDIDLLRVV